MPIDPNKVNALLGSQAVAGLGLGLLSGGWRGALPGYVQGSQLDAYNRRYADEQALQKLKLQQEAQKQQAMQRAQQALLGPYVNNPWTNPDNPQAGPQMGGGLLDSAGLDPAHKAVATAEILSGNLSGLSGLLPKPAEPYTLAPGAIRFDPNNKQVAAAPTAPPAGFTNGPNGLRVDPNWLKAQVALRAAGRTSVTNNVGSRFGTIPQGYELIESPQGAYMKAIPGGPADTSRMQAEQAGARETKSDVAATAYQKANDLIGGTTTGIAGQALSSLPPTNAAELRRQVDVLKSMASIESLNAMRRQSPTGGALGNVTERENAMLANAAGALDPNASPSQFRSALDNYYHTLLRIVNGPEAGDQLFQRLQQGAGASGGNTTSSGVQWRVVQ